ncbi:MAG: Gfo/Idh/MocA family protein [Suipraeoptans sp.]
MKVGIIGTGNIASKMAQTISQIEGMECYAIASRNMESAEVFKKEYEFLKAYGSYEQMIQDEGVELVYIATPNSCHFDEAMNCLSHNKPVLVEKAFTVNAKQAEKLVEASKVNDVLLTEGMWTRFMPSVKIIKGIICEGTIGEIVSINANMGNNVKHMQRIVDPELAGGALLDVGIYALTFSCMFLGTEIEMVHSLCKQYQTGVDAANVICLKYKKGQLATLHSSIINTTDRSGVIYGTKGYIVADNINNIKTLKIYNAKNVLIKNMSVPKQISGYEYELIAVKNALEKGYKECEEMTRAESVEMMRIMDQVREQWND